ncbi:hypothetical protein Tco_0575006 [Tanacetum coccineum]
MVLLIHKAKAALIRQITKITIRQEEVSIQDKQASREVRVDGKTPVEETQLENLLNGGGKMGPQEPEPSVSDDKFSEYSTCQSNDSEGSIGTSSEHSLDPESEILSVPPEAYVPTPISTNEKVHLIKDCDYYEKKMAKEAEVKKQRVCNTGNMMAKPVWTNTNMINHANQFVPRPVQLKTGRPNINSVRTNINTAQMSQSHAVSRKIGDLLKTSQDHPLKKHGDAVYLKYQSLHYLYTTHHAKGFACLIAKATSDESKLWHKRTQANPHAGTSEVTTHTRVLSQTSMLLFQKEKMSDARGLLFAFTVKNTTKKVESRKSSANSKKEEILIEPQQENGKAPLHRHFRR